MLKQIDYPSPPNLFGGFKQIDYSLPPNLFGGKE